MFDYEMKTSFMKDFMIAEQIGGESAVRDTFKRAFEEWKTNVEYITELTMVLNWRIWALYENNEPLARVYQELWEKADLWCMDNLKGDDLSYFIRTTD